MDFFSKLHHYDFRIGARDEETAYRETVKWMELLGYNQLTIDVHKWLVDHIPDDKYSGLLPANLQPNLIPRQSTLWF